MDWIFFGKQAREFGMIRVSHTPFMHIREGENRSNPGSSLMQ